MPSGPAPPSHAAPSTPAAWRGDFPAPGPFPFAAVPWPATAQKPPPPGKALPPAAATAPPAGGIPDSSAGPAPPSGPPVSRHLPAASPSPGPSGSHRMFSWLPPPGGGSWRNLPGCGWHAPPLSLRPKGFPDGGQQAAATPPSVLSGCVPFLPAPLPRPPGSARGPGFHRHPGSWRQAGMHPVFLPSAPHIPAALFPPGPAPENEPVIFRRCPGRLWPEGSCDWPLQTCGKPPAPVPSDIPPGVPPLPWPLPYRQPENGPTRESAALRLPAPHQPPRTWGFPDGKSPSGRRCGSGPSPAVFPFCGMPAPPQFSDTSPCETASGKSLSYRRNGPAEAP